LLDAASSLELLRSSSLLLSCSGSSGEAAAPSSGAGSGSLIATPNASCIFCGGLVAATPETAHNNRKRTLTSLGLFVSLRCQATPHAYQYFSSVRGEARVLLCVSCVNWQRRACAARSKGSKPWKRPLLFIDQFVLFMLKPGTTPFPDQRCVLRLVHALRRAGTSDSASDWVPGLLLSLLPVPVQAMVLSLDLGSLPTPPLQESSILNAMVSAWWEYNGRTAFFSHHLTAKLVRRTIKAKEAAPAASAAEAGAGA
jgi:hypothetical protein